MRTSNLDLSTQLHLFELGNEKENVVSRKKTNTDKKKKAIWKKAYKMLKEANYKIIDEKLIVGDDLIPRYGYFGEITINKEWLEKQNSSENKEPQAH